MVVNDRIAELIRESRADEIPSAIRDGAYFDMQTLTQALIDLTVDGLVDRETATNAAPNAHDFRLALEPRREGDRGRRDGASRRCGSEPVAAEAQTAWPDRRYRAAPRGLRSDVAGNDRRGTTALSRDDERAPTPRSSFVPGLAIGSFLNVVAARVPVRVSIVAPGSSCPACSSEIAWYDNIPVLSYLLLRGRCRGCSRADRGQVPAGRARDGNPRSRLHPRLRPHAERRRLGRLLRDLVALTVTDLERRSIPNRLVLPAAVFVLVGRTAIHQSPQLGDRRARRRPVPARSPRSPTPAASAWATSSSRSCSAPRSARRCRSR